MLSRLCGVAATVVLLAGSGSVCAAELYVGAASADITPDKPAPLSGQFHLRISTGVESPLTANAVAIESHRGINPSIWR